MGKKATINSNSITVYDSDLPQNLDLGSSIAIDTEAMGLDIKRDRLCVVQIADIDGNIYIVKLDRSIQAPNLKALLTDDGVLKIFHFARFDCAILQHYLSIKINNIYCTKVASKLGRTFTDKHSLKELCRSLLDVDISKAEQTSYWGSEELSKEQLSYAAIDVAYLHQLKSILDSMLKREERDALAKRAMETLKLVVDMDLNHFKVEDIFSH